MGVIFKNENTTGDMIEILKELQSYLPYTMVNGMKVFTNQLCAGDQLSVERAVHSIHSVSNGYMPEDRLEGFRMQLGDWHTRVKILEKRSFILSQQMGKFIRDLALQFGEQLLDCEKD
ncbi:Hypothetical predicted protein [Paramuricea clavata]|uniref:Uncharacterized protein n=1 Tax=Paramuricea clavata TaxID=317549 RepID=A0A6S7GJ60_PARCT|nr:Hypothetical predicted protein [Paramuricea clavata]